MRVVIQRVKEARVEVEGSDKGLIEKGLLILLGVEEADELADVDWLVKKITQMRIFTDEEGKMNLSVKDVQGNILLISQFTLHASTKKGNRPSFIRAASAAKAEQLYQTAIAHFEKEMGHPIQTGSFGAHMQVHLLNDGPVTITMDSKDRE